MAGGADNLIPAPLDSGTDALIHAAPVYGTIIVAMALFIVWIIRELLQSKAAHIGDLKTMFPMIHEMKETIAALTAALSRRSQR